MKKRLLVGLVAVSVILSGCATENQSKNEGMNDREETKLEEQMDQAESTTTKDIELVEMTEDETTKADETTKMEDSIASKQVNQGNLAPDFNLSDLDGNMYKLSDQKGKKIYVKHWASWCPICLAGLSETDEISKDAEDYEVVTVVSPGHFGEMNKEDFIKWFKSLGYKNMKVLLDESGKFIEDYHVRSAPTSVIVGSDGVLVKVIPGQLNKEILDQIYEVVQ